jgi:GTP cyclohydrolase IA
MSDIDPSLLKQAAITSAPSPCFPEIYSSTSKEEKTAAIASHIKAIMELLGMDTQHNSLKKTPERVATMYVNEMFSGLDLNAFPSIALFEQEEASALSNQMVFTKTSIVSFCEHHLVPMTGTAYIAYLPKEKIIGLSKLSRIARYFAARPQLQERLTFQIGDSLSILLEHNDVAVCVVAKHSCVTTRGARDESAETVTFFTEGIFKTSNEARREFLDMIQFRS